MTDHFAYQTSLQMLEPATATEAGRNLLEQSQQEFGMIPNVHAVMANLPGLLQTYKEGYNRFREQSELTPAEQEVVFLTVSRENECSYCVAGHSIAGDYMSNVPAAVTDAIRDGKEIPDARLAALSAFTLAMMRKHGHVSETDAAAFHAAGFTDKQMLAVILAIGMKTLSNYTNHLFNTALEPVMASRAWTPAS